MNRIKTGTIGAEGSGKSTLTRAIIACVASKGDGWSVDLGCDPGMTIEGRELESWLNLLRSKNALKPDLQIVSTIRESAYFLWVEAGKPEGRDLEFWCKAERKILGLLQERL